MTFKRLAYNLVIITDKKIYQGVFSKGFLSYKTRYVNFKRFLLYITILIGIIQNSTMPPHKLIFSKIKLTK